MRIVENRIKAAANYRLVISMEKAKLAIHRLHDILAEYEIVVREVSVAKMDDLISNIVMNVISHSKGVMVQAVNTIARESTVKSVKSNIH